MAAVIEKGGLKILSRRDRSRRSGMRPTYHVSEGLTRLAAALAILAAVVPGCNSKPETPAPATPAPQAQAAPPFSPVAPTLPPDFPNGASNATLIQAGTFAWQEFFALNWPAAAGVRDTPDTSKFFGDQTVPLVWQTYRAKVEIFPGNFNSQTKTT